LKESARPTTPTTGSSSGATRSVTIIIEARSPGARHIDDHRSQEAAGSAAEKPVFSLTIDGFNAAALGDDDALRLAGVAEREDRPVRIGSTVAPGNQSAHAVPAQSRDEVAQLHSVKNLFMTIAELTHTRLAPNKARHVLLGLGDEELAVGMKSAIVSNQPLDPVPDVHGFERNRDFCDVSVERPHATRGGSGGVASHPPALDHHDPSSGTSQMQCCRQAMQSTADHGYVERFGIHAAGSRSSRQASSPSVTGFSGGRMR
jgi:hypothetical protein